MNQSEPNTPDEFWKKAFEEAAETPPPRVWDTIERRLDESKGPKILPLWGTGLAAKRPVVWSVGVAATAAILFVGSWLIRSQTADHATVARVQPPHSSAPIAMVPARPGHAPANGAGKEGIESVTVRRKSSTPSMPSLGKPAEHSPATLISQSTGEPLAQAGMPALAKDKVSDFQPTFSMPSMPEQFMPSASRMAVISATSYQPTALDGNAPDVDKVVAFEPLATQPMRLREPAAIGRIVWFHPAEPMESDKARSAAIQAKQESKEVWASVSLMPGAFNPAVTLRSMQPSVAYASALSTSSNANPPSVSSRAHFSVAYLADAGIQLNEHWSLESGVGYLVGRSTVESPTAKAVASIQLTNANPGAVEANLYVDALRNSSRNQPVSNGLMASAQDKATNSNYVVPTNYDNQTRQTLTNDYQYVQVPIQVGYQLRPRKRLSLALLGGFLTNIFVRNTVGDELVITSKDGIYRPLSWAANLGARFRYRPSRRWSASLAGIYQPSLGPGTQPNSQVQTNATATGLRFGVDYHF